MYLNGYTCKTNNIISLIQIKRFLNGSENVYEKQNKTDHACIRHNKFFFHIILKYQFQ